MPESTEEQAAQVSVDRAVKRALLLQDAKAPNPLESGIP